MGESYSDPLRRGKAGAKWKIYSELLTDSLAPMIFSTFKTIFGILS